MNCCLLLLTILFSFNVWASKPSVSFSKPSKALPELSDADATFLSPQPFSVRNTKAKGPPVIFDIPMAYNNDVKHWIRYFQTNGRGYYKKWLERSHLYLPRIQQILEEEGVPKDLAYMAMIESGFSSLATSKAAAVGPWQFIRATGERYGLKVTWWLDERRDFDKSTRAAAKYLKWLYSIFKAWHLVAAAYNTGEMRIINQIQKHRTTNFWTLSDLGALHDETKNYVPKLIAAILIAKAPNLYGFRSLDLTEQLSFEYYVVPPGTSLHELADHLGVTRQMMKSLNPELTVGFVPINTQTHVIRIPKGSTRMVTSFIRKRFADNR